jgi:hypothetical protein
LFQLRMTATTPGKRVVGRVGCEREEAIDRAWVVAMWSRACIDDLFTLMA